MVATVLVVLAIVAFICAVLSLTPWNVPLQVAVILLCVIELIHALPVGLK